MAKYLRSWNETIYRRYIREGRGQGTGENYKPWLTVRDFPSLGMVSRIKGTTTGRIYHLMSNNETNLFYLLDWSDDVLDIREQYPLLDLKGVINIAEKARIRYPYDNKSGFPYVMTSDFFIETTAGDLVLSVKPSSELTKPRVLEKLEIERRYWMARNVKWELVTEHEINSVKARNVEWLLQARDLARFNLSDEEQSVYIDFFMSNYSIYESSLIGIFNDVEKRFKLPRGMGLNIYKHLIYAKIITVDVSQPFNLTELTCKSNKDVTYGGIV